MSTFSVTTAIAASSSPKTLWTYEISNDGVRDVAVAGDYVLLSISGTIYGVDVDTGMRQWAVDTGDPRTGPVTVGSAEQTAYTRAGGTVYAIDVATGQHVWTYDTDTDRVGSPQSVNEVVLFETDRQIIAIDATSGKEAWTFRPSSATEATSLSLRAFEAGEHGATENLVLVSGLSLYRISPVSGEIQWSITPGSYSTKSSTGGVAATNPTQNGVVGVRTDSERMYGVDVYSGTTAWSFNTGFGTRPQWASVGNQAVFALNDGRAVKIDATSGQQLWEFKFEGDNRRTMITSFGINEIDFVIAADGVYALEKTTGNVEWSFASTTSTARTTSAYSYEGRTYITDDGSAWALNPETAEPYWKFETQSDDVWLGAVSPLLFVSDRAVYRIQPTTDGINGSSGPVARYDANEDGEIDLNEVRTAINDFAAGDLELTEIRTIINYWANGA
jgi:outer membrane protein assembly factor BamB